ncbi:MAG: hypothetical protein JXX29_21890 [Deltaproteobacteria bacterium]|nr:hypothetical protein [Deltaproteobacteria bacterium]MBN2674347.1 hypothetical protein [Deltaproteobacteria bacterium]
MKPFVKISSFFTVVLIMAGVCTTASAGEFTDVIDAFDKDNGDPFDANIRIGYERSQETGDITRETLSRNPAFANSWDYYSKYKFGTYKHSQNILNLGVDLGLFRDISFRFDVPIILSDDRSLTRVGGWDPNTSTQLFAPSLRSPQRSGVDYLAAGLWWAILDQSRTKEHPTLTAFVEGRFAVGKKLTAACVGDAILNYCNGDTGPDGTEVSEDGGISNNVNQLRLGLHFSRRYGFLEPYMGIDGMLGFYKGDDLTMSVGSLNDMPPLVGTFDFGMELIPWEVPEHERKLVIVLGGGATYHSEGRTYTPLFDALGTAVYFKDPVAGNADINDDGTTDLTPGSDEAEALAAWSGMTDIENYAEFFGKINIAIQPAKYVKFNLGFRAGHKSEHFITKTDQCPAGSVDSSTGLCSNYNPGHRPEIDEPGTRFRVEKTFVWSLFLDATAQF